MQRFSKSYFLLIIFSIFFISGCATNRGVVRLEVHDNTVPVELNGKTVFIESVDDKRIFEENPKTQDIPSLGFGGSSTANSELKKRAIARKRNGFGKALGDILLEKDQTVETVISKMLETAFSEAGYKVVKNKEKILDDTLIVKASIRKFWAYMTPGFWAITLSSDISTDIEVFRNNNSLRTVTVHSEEKYQMGTEGNYLEIIDLSLKKYIEKVKEEFGT